MKHALTLLTLTLLVGCGTTKRVTITTEPTGASIYLTSVNMSLEVEQAVSQPTLLGTSPVTKTLSFTENQLYVVEARLDQFENVQADITYEPVKERAYHLQLKREIIDIKLIDFEPAPTGQTREVRLVPEPRITRAYLDTLEPSANLNSLTRITNHDSPDVQIGAPVLSPSDDVVIYPVVSVQEQSRPRQYTVQPGDTLDSVAALLQTRAAVIRTSNNLPPDRPLVPGSVLNIPVQQVYSNIWKQSIGSFAKTRLTYGQWRDLTPAFSPDGQYIVFASNRVSPNPTLWRIKTDGGGGITKITATQAEDYFPVVSPNGQFIAYASNLPGAPEPQVWTVNADGSLATQLHAGTQPQVSPDGKYLMYTRADRASGSAQLWMMTVDGTSETQLTQNTDFDIKDARFSPDGRWIVFAADEAEDEKGVRNFDIWLMTVEGRRKTRLTANGSWDDRPCFSRDGRTIYFRSNRGGVWNIWRVEPILP